MPDLWWAIEGRVVPRRAVWSRARAVIAVMSGEGIMFVESWVPPTPVSRISAVFVWVCDGWAVLEDEVEARVGQGLDSVRYVCSAINVR